MHLDVPGGKRAHRERDTSMIEMASGDLQSATHGTSLGALRKISEDGHLSEAKNTTLNKKGVYCEGPRRRNCCVPYSTLNFAAPDTDDLILYSAFVEIAVNRNAEGATSIHQQWVQPVDSIIIAGVHIHCINITKLFVDGYLGWFKYAKSVDKQIEDHQWLRDRIATPAAKPKPVRASSQPPPFKCARLTAAEPESSGDDSSDSTDPSVKSSNSEQVAAMKTTTEKMAKVTLVPKAKTDDFQCDDETCKPGRFCSKCTEWYNNLGDFARYKDIQPRGKAARLVARGDLSSDPDAN